MLRGERVERLHDHGHRRGAFVAPGLEALESVDDFERAVGHANGAERKWSEAVLYRTPGTAQGP